MELVLSLLYRGGGWGHPVAEPGFEPNPGKRTTVLRLVFTPGVAGCVSVVFKKVCRPVHKGGEGEAWSEDRTSQKSRLQGLTLVPWQLGFQALVHL